jgi:acetyl-CoA carboxylase biotin carboxylase subunit
MASSDMIRSLLIANRGEIARRIMRTCRRLGIRAVGVYSDADAHALHVAEADAAVRLGPAAPAESYLNIAAILDVARRAGADAVHPGYGFLAENAPFAHAVAEAGLTFIGPSPAAIAAMGDKRAARTVAEDCGVPVLPGFDGGDQSDDAFVRAAERIGYPIMVKAAHGGGGKGMRLVAGPDELREALAGARRESSAAFGSEALLLERALLRPRHVEIQVMGDRHGHVIHLCERDCSVQRRHQKVIEESPAPDLSPALRAEMGAAAVALARAIDYAGAGTVEFLLDADGRFYFLEMNTRLQVEHPVTELVTGIDLVEWQIRVAEGEPLPWEQDATRPRGHAIEARLCAEDPANNFLPTIGAIALWQSPAVEGQVADGLRVDGGISTGDEVTVHYDPLLVKIIAHADTRGAAIRRLRRALERLVLLGLTTNRDYLLAILRQPAFESGELSIRFLDDNLAGWRAPEGDPLAIVAAALARWRRDAAGGPGYWRNNPGPPISYPFRVDGDEIACRLWSKPREAGRFAVALSPDESQTYDVRLESDDGPDLTLTIDGLRRCFAVAQQDNTWWISTEADTLRLEELPLLPAPQRAADAGGSLRAPMPGTVLAVLVEVGQTVVEGQPLMKLEAMKMEHTIHTAAAGLVEAIYFAAGDQVGPDELLVRIIDG